MLERKQYKINSTSHKISLHRQRNYTVTIIGTKDCKIKEILSASVCFVKNVLGGIYTVNKKLSRL